MQQTPINVITGFLGAGKTTIVANLVKQLPNPEKVVWLKNEYGDANVDELLMKQSNIQPVGMLNGCLCCVLVGRLGNALEEILQKYTPERIIVESSGTAYPGPIVLEVSKIPQLRLDSVVNVIDCLNFGGYNDGSYAAKLQSKVIDLIVLNKYPDNPSASEELALEDKLDDVYLLNPLTPKYKSLDGHVPAEIVFGLDQSNFAQFQAAEVAVIASQAAAEEDHAQQTNHTHHQDEVQAERLDPSGRFSTQQEVEQFLQAEVAGGLIRAKGALRLANGKYWFVNWVYSRCSWTELSFAPEAQILVLFRHNVGTLREDH